MAQTIIANLPDAPDILPENYVIIEKPGVGKGTYKSTVGQLQNAITVHATVEQENDVTTITVSDINGTTQETIVTPTATIHDNGDGTATITITDTHGVTTETIVSKVQLDPVPIEGSDNLLTSGTIFTVQINLENRIEIAENRITDVENRETSAESHLDEIDERIEQLNDLIAQTENRLTNVEDIADRAIVIESNNEVPEPFKIDGETYDDFESALLAASEAGKELRLVSNAHSKGISLPSGSEVVMDLNGYTLTMTGPGSGSPGTKTLGMQLLMGSKVTFKNGSIVFNDSRLKMGIQNYCDLTLDNVKVSGGSTITYVVSNNHGNVVFKNGTEITPSGTHVAFDVWYGMAPVYYDGVNVTIADDTVQINGKVEFGKKNGVSGEDFERNASLTTPTDMELNLSLLNRPCYWTDNGDGSKTLRFNSHPTS